MRNNFFLALLVSMAMVSCNSNLVFSDYQPMTNGNWNSQKPVNFEFSGLDSLLSHNMYITIRNDNTFAFGNLFLIAELEHPNGETQKDTLEYKMAEPSGEWLGKGVGSIKENKLWFHEKVVFPDSGVYKVSISHAMRKNGEVQGVHILEGITDVGLEIEKTEQ